MAMFLSGASERSELLEAFWSLYEPFGASWGLLEPLGASWTRNLKTPTETASRQAPGRFGRLQDGLAASRTAWQACRTAWQGPGRLRRPPGWPGRFPKRPSKPQDASRTAWQAPAGLGGLAGPTTACLASLRAAREARGRPEKRTSCTPGKIPPPDQTWEKVFRVTYSSFQLIFWGVEPKEKYM